MTLDELDRLARAKILRDDLSKGILAMLAVIRAADAMREVFVFESTASKRYDAARAELEVDDAT